MKNCKNCGAIFVDAVRDICRDCYREEEEAFKTVYKFLANKKNREATLAEISQATEVEEELIIKFMKQKRLRASQFPKLSYPCDQCGVAIVEGRLCHNCLNSITSGFKKEVEVDKQSQKNKAQKCGRVYYTINKDR